jgi:PKD repeat protein
MKRLIVFLSIIAFAFPSCKVKPEACYTIDKPRQELHAKTEIQFTSCSDNAETLRWDFGDGTKAEGIQVKHLYTLPGDYRIIITAVNGDRSDEVSETLTIIP